MGTPNSFAFDGQSYASSIVRRVLDRLMAPGVLISVDHGLAVVQSVPAAMTVELEDGGAFLQGGYWENPTGSGNIVLAVPANSSGATRLDRVCLSEDLGAQSITLNYRVGSSSVYALVRAGNVWEMSLAQVAVPNNASSITQAAITDERNNAAVCGPALSRGVAVNLNPALPDDISVGAGIVHHLYVGAQTVTVPAGKQWLVARAWNAAATATITAGGQNFLTVVAGAGAQLPWPVLLDAGTAIVLPSGCGIAVYETAQSPTRSGLIAASATTTLYAVPAGERLVIQHINAPANANSLYDSALGTTLHYFDTPQYYSGSFTYGSGVIGGAQAPPFSGLPFPIIVPGGRTIMQANATSGGCILFGYLEASGETLV